jgi:hypothetical protein
MHVADREAIDAAVARLGEAAHPHDYFGVTVPARRVLGVILRRHTYRRAGLGWRLGVVALTVTGGLHAVGQISRASRQVLPGHQAESARERRALKEALVDARFPEGATVLLDPEPVTAEGAGPIVVRNGRLFVRWMPSAPDSALTPLPAYLAERVALALAPADPTLTAESSHDTQETR